MTQPTPGMIVHVWPGKESRVTMKGTDFYPAIITQSFPGTSKVHLSIIGAFDVENRFEVPQKGTHKAGQTYWDYINYE